jgi:hypothetical protein
MNCAGVFRSYCWFRLAEFERELIKVRMLKVVVKHPRRAASESTASTSW